MNLKTVVEEKDTKDLSTQPCSSGHDVEVVIPNKSNKTVGSESSSQEIVEPNPYLALRAAKIARNEARLRELGLTRPRCHETKSIPPKRVQQKLTQPAEPIDPSRTRRSPRHTKRPDTYVVPDPPEPKRKRVKPQHASNKKTLDTSQIVVPTKSVRNIKLDVGELCAGLLGIHMEQTGKAHVIEESARRAAVSQVYGLSFNKYCGVQEWNNDALFLWVNLGDKGTVINDFMNDGQQMTWFGGSRMHDESNVILRLLRVGQLAKDGQLPATDGIVLWCRQYDDEKRTHGPYVCLGRLAYHSHVAGSRPIQFTWTLLDHDLLMKHKQAIVRQTFQSMIRN